MEQRVTLQLPCVPPSVANPSVVGAERWTKVTSGKIGKMEVSKKGRVYFWLGDAKFQAFPGVEKRGRQQLIQLKQSKKDVDDGTLYQLGTMEKTIILIPDVILGGQ